MSISNWYDDDSTADLEPAERHTREEDARKFRFDHDAARTPLRDYQRELVDALARRAATAAPGSRLLVHLATGGGKTRVCNDWLWHHALPRGGRVLWVTKDWELLRQAASDLCQRYQSAPERLGYVGRAGRAQLPVLDENPRAGVVYTTIQSWGQTAGDDLRRVPITHVVIDEVHWGAGADLYKALYRRYRDSAVFVGLTATPRGWMDADYETVGRSYTFADLVAKGMLARPVIEAPVHTGVRWRPERSGAFGDFKQNSLETLARSAKRNKLIVDRFLANRGRYGKTLVFACNVAHAERLMEMFRRAGVSAEAVHSGMDRGDRHDVINRFRHSEVEVLVNVAMLTHGVDIPDIRTVFFARPTASPILASQMRGRGARLAPGKTEFNLVNFDDILEAHSGDLINPADDVGPAERTSSVRLAPSEQSQALPPRHSYAPAPIQLIAPTPMFETLQGLEYQPEQTFGIEFEFTRDGFEPNEMPRDWKQRARELLGALREAGVPTASEPSTEHGHAKDNSVWNVEWDASCGWEVTSRILKGAAGFFEVKRACERLGLALGRIGLKVNASTGTHVHLGWKPDSRKLGRLMELVATYEPALMSLVPPSRAGNGYCRPVREVLRELRRFEALDDWRHFFGDPNARYLTVNPSNLFTDYGTVEVRLHSGTWEAEKILAWTSLWMRMIEAVDRGVGEEGLQLAVSELPLSNRPTGDIARLCQVIGAGPELVRRLRVRRAQVVEASWLANEKYGARALEAIRGWANRA